MKIILKTLRRIFLRATLEIFIRRKLLHLWRRKVAKSTFTRLHGWKFLEEARRNLFSLSPLPPFTNFPFSREGEPRKFVAHNVSAGRNENATAKLPISSPRIFLAPLLSRPLSPEPGFSPFRWDDEKRWKRSRSILSFLSVNSPANSPELATTSGTEISKYTCTMHTFQDISYIIYFANKDSIFSVNFIYFLFYILLL